MVDEQIDCDRAQAEISFTGPLMTGGTMNSIQIPSTEKRSSRGTLNRALAMTVSAVLLAVGSAAILFISTCDPAAAAIRIEGQVQGGGAPIANSTVTLWGAGANEPSQLAQVQTDPNGGFEISVEQSPGNDTSLYLVAKGGESAVNKAGGANPTIGLITVLGGNPPAKVIINEMTTVASVWTHNQFLGQHRDQGSDAQLAHRGGQRAQLRRSR